jgi:hypothetical protein
MSGKINSLTVPPPLIKADWIEERQSSGGV